MVLLDPQAKAVLEYIDSLGDPPLPETTPEAARATRRSRLQPSAIEVEDVRAVDAGGIPARLYRPRPDEGLGLLVYFHGGGWVFGDLDTHDATCRGLAVSSGHAVLSVDYRLAPEHPFPAPLDDALSATAWAHENAESLGCDPEPARGRWRLRRRQPRGASSASVGSVPSSLPAARLSDRRRALRDGSYEEFADGPFLTRPSMDWFIGHYLSGGAGAADDPRVSPLLASDEALAASPPTLS